MSRDGEILLLAEDVAYNRLGARARLFALLMPAIYACPPGTRDWRVPIRRPHDGAMSTDPAPWLTSDEAMTVFAHWQTGGEPPVLGGYLRETHTFYYEKGPPAPIARRAAVMAALEAAERAEAGVV